MPADRCPLPARGLLALSTLFVGLPPLAQESGTGQELPPQTVSQGEETQSEYELGFAEGYAQAEYDYFGGEEEVVLSEEDPGGWWWGTFSFDVVSQYVFRGFLIEDDGLITQPSLELGMTVIDGGDGAFNGIDVKIGNWNSWHNGPTGSGDDEGLDEPDFWFEADLYGIVTARLFDYWSFSVEYQRFESPSNFFDTSDELIVQVNYDDSRHWESIYGLYPYVKAAFDLDLPDQPEGSYLELGIVPSMPLIQHDYTPVTLVTPVIVGLSLEDYYIDIEDGDEATFGFLNLGAFLYMPLSVLNRDWLYTQIYAGVELYFLSDALREFNDPDLEDNPEAVFTTGISFSF